MRPVDWKLGAARIDSNRGHLSCARMNVYDKWRVREHLREFHLDVEQCVESAELVEPEVGGGERSTREHQPGSSRRMLSSSTGFCPDIQDRITRVVCPRSSTVIAVSQSLIFHPLPGAALFAMSRVDGDQGRAACPKPLEFAKSTTAEPE
jgi:hypothetical protein